MYKLSDSKHPIVLASSSPRRQQLFEQVGIPFSVRVSAIIEQQKPNESAQAFCSRLALEKAQAVADSEKNSWIVGADTIVVVDENVLGKPESVEDSRQMLERISGRWHTVLTACAIVCKGLAYEGVQVEQSEVEIRKLSQVELDAYANSGEGRDKAGSYAIQGIGACIVSQIRGSFTNVVGLDMSSLVARLSACGAIFAGN